MGEFPEEDRVGDDLERNNGFIEFSSTGFSVEGCADRVLHQEFAPRIHKGGEHRADGNAPNGSEVEGSWTGGPNRRSTGRGRSIRGSRLRRRGFNGEGELRRKMSPTYRVFRQFTPNWRFLDDACCDTEGEGDEEKLAETGGLEPVLLAGLYCQNILHEGDKATLRWSAGRDEVVDGGNTNYPSSDHVTEESSACARVVNRFLEESSMDRRTA